MGKEIHDMIKEAYGDAAKGRSSIFEWHKLFREGKEIVEDDHFGGPSTSKTNPKGARVKNVLNSDRIMDEYQNDC
ncbi:uncharacterized protein TNCV_3181841 [Trichonephila clavipes]|nr:uncharacterized protein TNCV_3181841 [Trichonephila clavipes]